MDGKIQRFKMIYKIMHRDKSICWKWEFRVLINRNKHFFNKDISAFSSVHLFPQYFIKPTILKFFIAFPLIDRSVNYYSVKRGFTVLIIRS